MYNLGHHGIHGRLIRCRRDQLTQTRDTQSYDVRGRQAWLAVGLGWTEASEGEPDLFGWPLAPEAEPECSGCEAPLG
jgi:hypothetical protein